MVRYAVKFITIGKELKKAKILKLKKPYNLLEAEQLLSSCYEALEALGKTSMNLSLEITETEQNEDFEFEDLTIHFRDDRELLIDVLTTDIYKSMETAEDDDQEALETLAEGLQSQVEDEYSYPERYTEQSNKKAFSLKIPFVGKKNKENPRPTETKSQEPYNATWDQPEEAPSVNLQKSKEIPEMVTMQTNKQEESSEIEYDDEYSGVEEETHLQETENQVKKQNQKVEYVARINGTYQNQDPYNRPETSALNSLETYANLTATGTLEAVEVVLTALKEETKDEDRLLFERFGVNANESDLTLLQLKKKDYLNSIKQSNFTMSLVSNFEKNVRALEKKASQVLISKYQSTRELTPVEATEEKLTQYKEQLALKAETNVNQVLERIDQECKSEEKQLFIKHENEMNALQMKQKSEREVVEQRFTQRKITEEDLATEENKKIFKIEAEEKRIELVNEEMTKRDEDLLLFKNQTLEGFSKGLQDIITAMKDTQDAYYEDLEARFKEQEESWKKEVAAEQRLAMRKVEQQLTEEQNRLKAKELQILEEAKLKESHSARTKDTLMQDILESNDQLYQKQREERRKNQEFQDLIESTLRTMQEKNSIPQVVSTEVVQLPQKEKKKRKILFPIVTGLCGLVLAGGGFFGYTELQTVHAKNQELQQSIIQLKENSVKQVEKDKKEPTVEKITLEDLLKDKKYLDAAEAYPDKLDVIENQLFKDKEIGLLTAFNVLYKSKNGALNQAILEGDNAKIIQAFEKNEAKENLSKDQEKSVALAYFATGKTEEGTKLITK